MPQEIPTAQQMDDLTQAISTLHPAIKRLEESMRAMDHEAVSQQQEMSEALNRIATALETMVESQANLLPALSEQKSTSTILMQTMDSLSLRLIADADRRTELAKTMTALIILLEGPA